MKKLLLVLAMLVSSHSMAEDNTTQFCDSAGLLAYEIAENYHEGMPLSQLNYIAENSLELSIINIVHDTQAPSISMAMMYREVCLDDPGFILRLLYTPL